MIRKLVFHPFLFGIYPIIALYSNNVYEANPLDLVGPIAIAVGLTGLLFGIAYAILRDSRRAALVASILIVLFFSVGRASDILNVVVRYLTSFWVTYHGNVSPSIILGGAAIVGLASCYWVLRKLKDPGLATGIVNAFALILIVMPVTNVLMARPPRPMESAPKRKGTPLAPLAEPPSKPDIYYIVLDSYARRDVMKALFDFDIQPFLDRLEKKGFYIAKHSTANYCQTRLCLSCSLNGVYIDDLVKGMGNDQTGLADLIGINDVVATLRPIGYKFVSFSSGFHETDQPESDVHHSPSKLPFTGFQRLLISTTPFGTLLPTPKVLDRFETIRERVLYKLEHIPDVASDPASTIMFAHFMCPHPPFLFGENGEDILNRDSGHYPHDGAKFDGLPDDKRVYYRGYREQAMFITRRIEQTIDRILANSKTPPIIILQSDHGSGMNLDMHNFDNTDHLERMTILNAYYFPDRRFEKLYDTISPVNSFRVIFNTFFGSDLKLLPDRSYYSSWGNPYEFHDVTQLVAGKEYPQPAQAPPPATADASATSR